MNAVGNIPYKDNEHLAVKCIVIHSPGMDGVLTDDSGQSPGNYVDVSGKLATPLLLSLSLDSA